MVMSATVVADASIIIPLDGKANPRAIVKTRTARAASLFVVSSLFIAVQPARALGIVLTNDDGFESALTYAFTSDCSRPVTVS